MIAQDVKPYLNTRNDSPFQFMGLPTVMRATKETTNGAFGLIESLVMPPGFASPYHTHHREDEAFYVLEGELAFVCGGAWTAAGPGTFLFGPREIPHGFKVEGTTPARMLLLCAPAGFEQFVLDLSTPAAAPGVPSAPPDMAKLVTVAATYGIDILGPLPEDTGSRANARSTDETRESASLKHALDESRNRHISAVNAEDVEAVVDLFAPDGVFLPPGQPALQGMAAMRGWFTQVFGGFRIQGFQVEPAAIDERGHVIIEHGSWSATFHPRDGSKALPGGGTYLTVYERLADGSVRTIRDAFNGLPG